MVGNDPGTLTQLTRSFNMARFVTGTVAQLADNLTLNGITLSQPEISVLTRLFKGSVFKQVGVIRKEGERGRPAIIWQVDTDAPMFLEVPKVENGLTASDDDAPEYVKEDEKAAAAA